MAPLMRTLRPLAAATIRSLPGNARYLSVTVPLRADAQQPADGELQVGELEGAKFRIEPLRRTGEDDATKRARLVCTSSRFPHTPKLYNCLRDIDMKNEHQADIMMKTP